MSVRISLQQHLGQTIHCVGTVALHVREPTSHRVLLRNVCYPNGFSDHAWINPSRVFLETGAIEGDRIEFTAVVEVYIRRSTNSEDYGLRHVRNVRIVQRNVPIRYLKRNTSGGHHVRSTGSVRVGSDDSDAPE